MPKSKKQMSDDLARLCNTAYEAWRADMIRQGWPHTKVTQNAFCQAFSFKATSWSGWIKGRVPRELDNIRQLAACPYIGKQVYNVLELVPDTDDARLREMMEAWPRLTEAEKKEVYETLTRVETYKNMTIRPALS